MDKGFGGHARFNGASPSSHDVIVQKIIEEFVPAGARILDVGGTATGFKARARLPEGASIVIANPEIEMQPDYPSVDKMPPNETSFDFAMLFGVIMYETTEAGVVGLLQGIRERLRAGGILLLADPDPESWSGWADAGAKSAIGSILDLFGVESRIGALKSYKRSEATTFLKRAGFVDVRSRDDLRPGWRQALPFSVSSVLPPYFVLSARKPVQS